MAISWSMSCNCWTPLGTTSVPPCFTSLVHIVSIVFVTCDNVAYYIIIDVQFSVTTVLSPGWTWFLTSLTLLKGKSSKYQRFSSTARTYWRAFVFTTWLPEIVLLVKIDILYLPEDFASLIFDSLSVSWSGQIEFDVPCHSILFNK